MPAVIFPNSAFPSTVNAQTNAQQFTDALWDFIRTQARAREDADLPGDDVANFVDIGGGAHVNHALLAAPTKWMDPIKHPTLNQWAVKVRALFVALVATDSANPTVAARATRIRNAVCSGATIAIPASGAVIANSFWTTDATATLARWNRLKQALDVAVATLGSDWFP